MILADISFDLRTREVLFVRGPSGVGKTLLLRTIACLDPVQGGSLLFNGETPQEIGLPNWRALITYVGQSRVNLKGTPAELYFSAQKFASQKGRPRGDLPALVFQLGLEQVVLNQPWAELSGGQLQRVALAIAIALKPAVLLLDEPTNQCDEESRSRVEGVVRDCDSAVIWVTHDPDQPKRVGGRILELPFGTQSTVEATLLDLDGESLSLPTFGTPRSRALATVPGTVEQKPPQK